MCLLIGVSTLFGNFLSALQKQYPKLLVLLIALLKPYRVSLYTFITSFMYFHIKKSGERSSQRIGSSQLHIYNLNILVRLEGYVAVPHLAGKLYYLVQQVEQHQFSYLRHFVRISDIPVCLTYHTRKILLGTLTAWYCRDFHLHLCLL